MNSKSYEKFKHHAIHELMRLNDIYKKEFRVDSWPRWDYQLDEAKLIFSDEGVPKVIADIDVVGTTASDNTWMWGWNNESLPKNCVKNIAKVKAFGEKRRFSQLTQPVLENDEYLGWELSAVAAQILGSKGAYRCPDTQDERFFTYVVLSDIRFATDADRYLLNRIDCDHHEQGFATYICEHLADHPAQKWFSEEPTEENRWPDAWCKKCDRIFLEAGEWNKKNSKSREIRLLCHHCYEEKRAQGTF